MRNRTRTILYIALLFLLILGGRLAAQGSLPGAGQAKSPPQAARPLLYVHSTHVAPLEPPAASHLERTPSIHQAAEAGPLAELAASSTGEPLADLTPHAPRGWSYPVTPASQENMRTVNALYAGQPTYFNWAVINQGSAPVLEPFQTHLYLDGQRVGSWETERLPAKWYAQVRNYAVTVATPGWHAVRLVADATNAIGEGNEFNNIWEYTFFWQPVSKPNLAPYTPAGWSGPVVPSSTPGNTTANALYVGQPTYINWSIVNSGTVSTDARFYTELYLDERLLATWRTDLLLPNWQAHVQDFSFTVHTPGWHTLRLVMDSTHALDESCREDNVWEGRFYWQGEVKPNLRPHTPPGWEGPLVLSAQAGGTEAGGEVTGPLYVGQPVYINWAMVNDSAADITARFDVHLYMDGLRIATWPHHGLPKQAVRKNLDWAYMVNTPGWRTFVLVLDARGVVDEVTKEDNVWEAKLWFQEPEAWTVGVEWVNSYFRSGLAPLLYNHINATGFADEMVRAGWTSAFNWGDNSAWEKDFKDVTRGGNDHRVVDAAALVYFSGHGNRNGPLFDTLEHHFQLHYSDALWGDGALNWIVFDTCLILNNDEDDCILRWGPAFAGLHMILGFDTECYDSPWRGQNLARYANGSYWWHGAMPIKDAWFHAAAVTEDARTYSAALVAIQPPIDPSNDYFPNVGSYSADPQEPTLFHLWRVQN